MAVVTVPDSRPLATPKQVATTLFNRWGIGQKGKDNGVLFLVSLGDRRVEIETGYGVESMLPDARIGQIIRQRITPQFKTGNFDAGTLLGTEAIVQVLRTQGNTLNASSASSELVENWLVPGVLSIVLLVLIVFGFLPLYPEFCKNLVASLQGLVGLVAVRGLGQSVKLQPRQSSRVKAWNLRFETIGSMRCAVCGGRLEPVASDAVEQTLRPNEKIGLAIGSLQFRGWRCNQCAPEAMHLRIYESTSNKFEYCPTCHELAFIKGDPYFVPSNSPDGPGLLILTRYCVNCGYSTEDRRLVPPGGGSSGDGSDWGGSASGGGSGYSGGGDFGGGSSGGGGAGGDW
ncbi:MAG: TPM domain-containing protein, partial [Synechococcaceae cyanobacterium]